MSTLKINTRMHFLIHLLSSLKKLILYDWEKDCTLLEKCLVAWQNKHRPWLEKNSMSRFCLDSVGVLVLRFQP